MRECDYCREPIDCGGYEIVAFYDDNAPEFRAAHDLCRSRAVALLVMAGYKIQKTYKLQDDVVIQPDSGGDFVGFTDTLDAVVEIIDCDECDDE